MNLKKETKKRALPKLMQGLAGVVLAVSAFVLPVSGFAEEAAANAPAAVAREKNEAVQQAAEGSRAPQKYVMPKEQVYLDPTQVEAAKKQLEADAFYNDNPQNNAAVAEEKKAAGGAKEEKPVAPENAVKEESQTAKPAAPEAAPEVRQEEKETAQQPAEGSRAPQKYVMPQEQVYLDPSQVEAAKQQLKADAFYNAQPQAKNVEVVTGDRVIADVKVVEKAEETVTGTETGIAQKETAKDVKPEKENTTKANVIVQPQKIEAEKPAATAEKNAPEVKPEASPQQEPVKEKSEILKAAEKKIEELKQKRPVRLNHLGLAREVTTHHATVGEVLKEMRVNMEGRTVYPPPETKVTDGMVIHVLARKSFLSQEEVEVPFGTQVIHDPELAFGTKKVEKEGVKGKDLVTYENITRPGREQKIELARRRVAEPVNEVVRQGVAQSVLTPEGYVRYKKKIYGEATAYTWGGGATGYTSVGLWPKRGIVAVDPRVIPYYTRMFIPGYGMALAADTGGAIVGNRIDLFMDSLHECFQWGRRDVEIYILE